MNTRITFLLVMLLLSGLIHPAAANANEPYLYEESFEQPIETWAERWDNATIGSRNRLSRIDGYHGQGIRVSIPQGQHFGSSLELPLPNLHEAWQSHWFRVPFPIPPTSQGKTGMGFAGNHYANCGQGGAGDNPGCWTARQGYSCRGRNSNCEQLNFAFYLYHPNQTTEFGDLEPVAMRLEYGTWYCVQTYVRMNTIGKADGMLAGFINGEWLYNQRVEFRTETNPTEIEGLWWDDYEGGSWTALSDMAFDYDELVVSEQFVERDGCLQAENVPAMIHGTQNQATTTSTSTTTTVPTTASTSTTTTTTIPPVENTKAGLAANWFDFVIRIVHLVWWVLR